MLDAPVSQMHARRRWGTWAGLLVVLLCFGLPLFRGLDHRDMHNDEASYSYGVQRILETGNWLTIRGTPDMEFLEKPPLKFWIVAGAMRAGLVPRNDIGMRAIDALFGALAFGYVYLLGVRMRGWATGAIAALVLFTFQPLIFDHGLRSDNMEAALLLAYCAGFYHLAGWIEAATERARRWHAMGVAASFVLGFMTKFVVIAFLPLGVIALVLAHPARRDLLALARMKTWIVPSVLAVLAIAPWFIYQTARVGWDFWRIILGQQVFARMSSGLDPSHIERPAFYAMRIWTSLGEAGSLWVVLAGLAWIALKSVQRDSLYGRLLLFWALVPLIAISVSRSKLIHYAYPFIPPLALGAGWWVAAAGNFLYRKLAGKEPSPVFRSPARAVMFGLGLLAVLLAAVTLAAGRLVWHVPHIGVLTNGSVFRPLAAAAILMWAATRKVRVVLLAPTLLFLSLFLPLRAYATTIQGADVIYRPLAAVNSCLRALRSTGAAMPLATYLPSGYPLSHAYYYYLREFGPYVVPAADRDLDKELSERLMPARLSMLIFTRNDFWQWRDRTGNTPAKFSAVVAEDNFVLVLQGAAAACAPAAVAAGAEATDAATLAAAHGR